MHGRDSSYLLMGTGLIMLGLLLIVGLSMRAQPEAVSGTHLLAVSGQTPMYPDKTLTPGARNPAITQATIGQTICNKNWSTKSERPSSAYTTKLKKDQLASGYTVGGDMKPVDYEEDHLISLELGGAPTDPKNLWPESYLSQPYNARLKDRVENKLHDLVCANTITLEDAQGRISTDWIAAYQVYFGASAARPSAKASVVGSVQPYPANYPSEYQDEDDQD